MTESVSPDIPVPHQPHAMDIHVGRRVRSQRKRLGLSQADLARALGLTFQQVQKYELGANRISASKLYEIARALATPIAYFFEDFSDDDTPDRTGAAPAEQSAGGLLTLSEGIELAKVFPRVRSSKARRRVLELIHQLAEDGSGNG